LIPSSLSNTFIYHFTPLDNLKKIIESGNVELKAKNTCAPAKDISEANIQQRRANTKIPFSNSHSIHDYVPFYFCSRSPMLLGVIKRKVIDQHDIIYFEFPINVLTKFQIIFTDASANTEIRPNFYKDLKDLSELSWSLINSTNWTYTDTDRHKKMAEALIYKSIPLSEAKYCVVWDAEIKNELENFLKKHDIRVFPEIIFESTQRRHWFTNFNNPTPELNGCSIVQGPKEKSSNRYRMAYSS
jgi:hypothetical protein